MHHLGRLHPNHRDDVDAAPIGARTRTVALCVLCLCALTSGLDLTITNVALPSIGTALDAPTSELQWTVDAYTIALAGTLVLGGALADRHGRRRIFLGGYALFAAATAVAAFSPTIGVLIGARALMGVGAAGVTAPALALIASMYPPEQRARAIGAFVVFGAAGLAIGPVAGGLLLADLWWGSVFLVNVPFAVAGVVVGALTIPESRAPTPAGGWPRLDLVGAALSVVGLTLVLTAIIEGPARGWSSPIVVVGLLGGAAAIVLFVRRELIERAPLFDVRILTRPRIATGAITLFAAYVFFNSFLFLNPQYLGDVQDESIVAVGLLFVPFAVVFGLCSLRAERVVERFGPRATITAGLVVDGIAFALLAVSVGRPAAFVVMASAVLAAGLSLLIAPPSTVVMNDLPPAKAGDGSSLNFVSRFVGGAVGVAVVGSILAAVYAADLGDAVASLDSADAAAARGSIQGALEVAQATGGPTGDALASAARASFEKGATVAYLAVAVLSVLAAAAAWIGLGREARTPS